MLHLVALHLELICTITVLSLCVLSDRHYSKGMILDGFIL